MPVWEGRGREGVCAGGGGGHLNLKKVLTFGHPWGGTKLG